MIPPLPKQAGERDKMALQYDFLHAEWVENPLELVPARRDFEDLPDSFFEEVLSGECDEWPALRYRVDPQTGYIEE